MKLAQFDGGLNTRSAPNLIGANQGVVYDNIDNESGLLTPVKQKSAIAESALSAYATKFDGSYVSSASPTEYLEYNDKLYKVDGTAPQKSDDGSTWAKLGIAGPTAACTGTPTNQPAPFTGVTTEARIFLPPKTFDFSVFGGALSGTYDYAIGYNTSGSVALTYIEFSHVVDASSNAIILAIPAPIPNGGFNRLYKYYSGAWWRLNTDFTSESGYLDAVPPTSPTWTNVSPATPTTVNTLPANSDYTYRIYNKVSGAYSEPYEVTISIPNADGNPAQIRMSDFTGRAGTTELYRLYGGQYKYLDDISSYTDNYDLVADPSANATLNYPINLNGTYQYVYTYYNVNDGTESKPSPISSEIVVSNGTIALSGITASADTQVTHKRIYRTGGTLTAFTLVDEIINATTTFNDTLKDTSVEGTILATSFYEECPVEARYIVESFGVAFVAAYSEGTTELSTLRFSEIGNFNYWPEANAIQFRNPIKGLGVTSEGVVVFTQYRAWLIAGTSPDTFVRYDLSNDQGCINHHTIVGAGNNILFASTDGICITNGGAIKVVSKLVLGKQSLSTTNAALHDEVYYLHLSDGSILAMDLRYGTVFKTLTLGTTRVYNFDDTLYGLSGGSIYELFASATDHSLTYTSPLLTNSEYTNLKAYKDFYVSHTDATMSLKVYLDGVLVHTQAITGSGVTDVRVPQTAQRGYTLQYNITGTGTINEIEHKSYDRQNGR